MNANPMSCWWVRGDVAPCRLKSCHSLNYMPTAAKTYKQITPRTVTFDNRPSAYKRGYGPRWQKARLNYLRQHPLCVECSKEGKTVQASDVDHIIPHKGKYELMWDESNWQSLCSWHHKSKTGKGL